MAKKEYVIVRGQVKQGTEFLQPGATVSLDEAEAKAMDPQGTCFMEKAKHDAHARAEKAAAAELAKAEAPKAEAPKGGK